MQHATDEELMERFVGGDASALDQIYLRHAPPVYGFAARLVQDRALAEDVLQHTFLSVLRSKDRYQRGQPVGPWLLTIAANAAKDLLRRRRTRGEVAAEAAAHVAADLPAPSDPGARKQLTAALEALPLAQREAVLLHKVHGLSFEQIGQALGTTALAARLRAHRGYERLRAALAHLEEPP